MAKRCNECMGEGRVIGTDEYCKCMFGRQKRAKDEHYVAQAKAEIEATKQLEKAKKKPKKADRVFAVEEGDWAEYKGYIGIIDNVEGDKCIFKTSHFYDPKNGNRVERVQHADAFLHNFLPAKIETFDNAPKMFMQAGILLKDEEMFLQGCVDNVTKNNTEKLQELDMMVEFALATKNEQMFMATTAKRNELLKKGGRKK